MKEKLHTIPIADAFHANDECPFCFVERSLEEHAMDFVLGSGASYMEDDIRAQTDAAGFCRMHYKKMFDYGNRLGAGLILKTHFQKLNQEFEQQMKHFSSSRPSLRDRLKKAPKDGERRTAPGIWAASREDTCYICNFYKSSFSRYIETFFEMYRKDPAIREMFTASKGFCIPHFGDLCETAARVLPAGEQQAFFDVLMPLEKENLKRIYDDLDWFCDKFDYRYKDADWKTSKDALPRSMQKAAGGYPADPPYMAKR
jgi:hypothetical protein